VYKVDVLAITLPARVTCIWTGRCKAIAELSLVDAMAIGRRGEKDDGAKRVVAKKRRRRP
jgi:hypothetical protein